MSMALKAHVKNGQLVLDEPTELPEGAEADVVVHGADPHDEMDEEERAELLRAIDEGLADVDAGDVVDFDDYLASLRARRA
jgi:formylmethanofuran dehydrogenase subunit A